MVEDIEGDYPTYVTQPSTGRVVPVVQVVFCPQPTNKP